MVFERFLELVMPQSGELFEKIIYIPGNHDHHMWEIARETQYANYIQKIDWNEPLPRPWHTTNMFVKKNSPLVPAYFLSKLKKRNPHLSKFKIFIAYPNFGLVKEKSQKCVIFHHGHFTEPIYQLMSVLKRKIFPEREKARHVWDVETENFAWIDFFWSTMGRSGDVGEEVESIYENMLSPEKFKKFLSARIDAIKKEYNLPGWDWLFAETLKKIVPSLVDHITGLERHQTAEQPNPSLRKGLKSYLEGPLKEQIQIERKQNMPYDVTFVFGHTHKPFQKDMNFDGYPQWVDVYNTGGWIVDTVVPRPSHGGAIIFIDERLNVTSLHMYHEGDDPAEYAVKVEQATHEGEAENPLYHRIFDLVDSSTEPWSTFADTVARAVNLREKNLHTKLNEKE